MPSIPTFGRRETILNGLVHTVSRGPIPCLVRDLKPRGARVLVEFTPPPNFRLVIDEMGLDTYCQVVARSQEGIEVAFE
jgi:hypothetical protein